MIVCSKKCFLNILTQLMDKETLINANYYILDQVDESGLTTSLYTDSMRYDEFGRLVVEKDKSVSLGSKKVSRFNVTYSNRLNPDSFAHVLYDPDNVDAVKNQIKKYTEMLESPDVNRDLYNLLFRDILKGNGLQIIIMSNSDNLKYFGNALCESLSKNFGVDITFVDAKYCKNVVGNKVQYKGNKERAKKYIEAVIEYDLMARLDGP